MPEELLTGTLVALAERAASCTPDCCGAAATAAVPDTDEAPPPTAVTHPDLSPLVAVQWESGEGPIRAAVDSGDVVGADDLLSDPRWPAYRTLALDAGVRSSVTLPFRQDDLSVTLTVCGFRPGLLTRVPQQTAIQLGDLATHALAHDHRYERAVAEVGQLDEAMRTRPAVDQACGILMHVLGCDADAAFAALRSLSQRTNSKLTDLAQGVVRTRGRGIEAELRKLR
ncbi:GAF and ANTAR domain-containing protein [Streptomyces sp. A7024]|uniref:GAF and ANTAR domain-containing protein n=1 Tax=Streptomyces coryli TaxID=1128680 RepID=A0A6G4UBU7_9ACTN|nr:GAF and ANTAR domain-containing protein [Streptomyces coryli]NGN68858.1 GAF and ANTAR domain-containing protein [Streptomyces coryli]